MSSYNELIKNFERTRAYMREFYVYGFKSREEYNKKSARSYDDERRRMESWLGDHMSFVRTPEGKSVFISIDSRNICHNPFYKPWKAKSFTDLDVTLHFIVFDILHSPEISMTVNEIMDVIDEEYLSGFDSPIMFDESTVRKKLKEYSEAGIITVEKIGRRSYYRRSETTDITELDDAIHYFSEVLPCGVIGSFILDKTEADSDAFGFKHHYITSAMDSGELAELFTAMRKKCVVTVSNLSRRKSEPERYRLIPLRIFISVQNGRQHLIAYNSEYNCMSSYRIDYLSDVIIEEPTPRFDELRSMLSDMQENMWGVNVRKGNAELEHIEFTVRVNEDEEHIVRRLEREKRVGRVEKIDENTYRFSADVYDTNEMVPWVRTFICRITQLKITNREVEKRFKEDLEEMYRMYGVDKEETE